MELLEFTFRDIYHFIGVVILLSLLFNGTAHVIRAFRRKPGSKERSKAVEFLEAQARDLSTIGQQEGSIALTCAAVTIRKGHHIETNFSKDSK